MNLTPASFRGKILLFSTFLAIGLCARSQSVNPQPAFAHTLLWRISGNGLRKPSYLFGTMHLTDKRLFHFGDSVYQAIEKTEGLAMEVNPDEMAAYLINKMLDQVENGKKLEDLVDKRYFEANRKALAKKFNKPAEEIKTSDVLREKNKWMSDYMEKGEMPTFMDAYLYGIARRQGKWLGGIEDITDQAGLLDDLVDKADVDNLLASDDKGKEMSASRSIEKMISLYLDQDLDGIEYFSNDNSTTDYKDRLLIRRNVKMAARIDSLTSLRTMFLAIGAAHLPGDSGVINLLRRRGFTLDPVFSGKRIDANNYTFKEVHLPWASVSDSLGTYTVDMPANPATVKIYGMVEMKFLLDIFNMSGYCTASVVKTVHVKNMDTLFNRAARQMFSGRNVKAVKKLEKNGLVGREFINVQDGKDIRVQLFADDKRVYMAMVYSMKKDVLSSPDANKFFQSFTIRPHVEDTPPSLNSFTDSVIGVSFDAPASMTYNEKLSKSREDSWNVNCFTGIDESTGACFMLISKEIKLGYFIIEEKVVQDNFFNQLKLQYNDLHRDSFMLDRTKIMRITGRNIKQPGLSLNAISSVRGGRHITFLVISDTTSDHIAAMQAATGSFHFVPHPSVAWRNYEAPDNTFSIYGPSRVQLHMNKQGNSLRWVSYDTTTATSYLVLPDTLGKYTWYTSDSVFWNRMLVNDTAGKLLLELRNVVNGDVSGKEYITRSKAKGISCYRTRLLLSGDKIYKLFVAGDSAFLYSPDVDRFFNDFRLKIARGPDFITVPKTALLLQDLSSSDSATRSKAFFAIPKAPFKKEDAPLLRTALFKLYQPPFHYSHASAINNKLAESIAKLKDSASVSFVRDAYPSLVNEKKILQNSALSLLAQQHTTYSYTTLSELLKQGPTAELWDYTELNALRDSLSLTTMLFPSLQSWAKDTLHAPAIAKITLQLLDSGYLKLPSVMASEEAFLQVAATLLPPLKTVDGYSSYRLMWLLKLIGRFHTPASYSLLEDYLSVKNKFLLGVVVKELLSAQQAVPSTILEKLAADPVSRRSLYNDLKEIKMTDLYPKLYLTQSSFAESAIYNASDEDDEGVIEKLVLLSKRTGSYRGKSYTWYLYKVVTSGDDEGSAFLGIAGGYDADGTGLIPIKDLTGIYWKETLNETNVNTLFKAYLKSLDHDEEE